MITLTRYRSPRFVQLNKDYFSLNVVSSIIFLIFLYISNGNIDDGYRLVVKFSLYDALRNAYFSNLTTSITSNNDIVIKYGVDGMDKIRINKQTLRLNFLNRSIENLDSTLNETINELDTLIKGTDEYKLRMEYIEYLKELREMYIQTRMNKMRYEIVGRDTNTAIDPIEAEKTLFERIIENKYILYIGGISAFGLIANGIKNMVILSNAPTVDTTVPIVKDTAAQIKSLLDNSETFNSLINNITK